MSEIPNSVNEAAERQQTINSYVNAVRHLKVRTKLSGSNAARIDVAWDSFLAGGFHLKHFHRGQGNNCFSIYLFLSGSQVCVGYVVAANVTGTVHEVLIRYADMATLFFWRYRRRSRAPKDKDFILGLAQAQADLETHPDWKTHLEGLEKALLAHRAIFPMEDYRATMKAHRGVAARVGSVRSLVAAVESKVDVIGQQLDALSALHQSVGSLLAKLDSHSAVTQPDVMAKLEPALRRVAEGQDASTAKVEELYTRLSNRLDDLTVKIETLSASL